MTQETFMTSDDVLRSFISHHKPRFRDYANVPIEETNLINEFKKYPLRLTHFDDIYDTLMYSELIQNALELSQDATAVVDLGAGSSIPSLLAIKNSNKKNVKAIAVDIDPDAREVGKHNATALGLSDDYHFISTRLEDALKTINTPRTIVVSNPPYIPAPETIKDHHFVPINGGLDGADYMVKLLNHSYPKGTTLALLWGSLTNPGKVLPMIEKKFEVLHVDVMKIHFGNYTSHPEIYEHLCNLRDEGKVMFYDDKTQLVIGTILRAK